MSSSTGLSEEDINRVCKDALAATWEAMYEGGIDPNIVASTAMSFALHDFVDAFGKERTAQIVAKLPGIVREGQFGD